MAIGLWGQDRNKLTIIYINGRVFMENIKSTINPLLTLKYVLEEEENKYFDRKSAKIKPSDIADLFLLLLMRKVEL